MATKTEVLKEGSVLLQEWSHEYCRDTIIDIDNGTGQSYEIKPGLALVNTAGASVMCANGTEGDCNAILLRAPEGVDLTLANGGTLTQNLPVLVRGPAVISQQALTAANTDASFTMATLVAALAALSPPIIVIDEPATTDAGTATS